MNIFHQINKLHRGIGEHLSLIHIFHRLGHSIGIDVHEPGDANTANTDLVLPGNVFSCEPGVYLAGRVGVRIEDLCMVTENGVQILNHYPKELQVID